MSGLRLGLQLNMQFAPGQVSPDRRFGQVVELVDLAREVGFTAIGVPQNHPLGGEAAVLHPVPVMAALASHTRGMEMATSVYLTGQYHPLEVAQQVATLDAISGGRLRLGVAAGGNKQGFAAMGVPYERRLSRFLEGLQVMKQLWTGEPVSHVGEHFRLQAVRLSLPPVQRPHPPIWMGAMVPKAAERAARLADAFLMSAHQRISEIEPLLAAYRSALAALDKPEQSELPILRTCYVAENREQAMRDTQPSGASSERVQEDRDLLGGPEEVAGQLLSLQSRLGVGLVILRIPRIGLSHEKVMRCVELAGREVRPRIEKASHADERC